MYRQGLISQGLTRPIFAERRLFSLISNELRILSALYGPKFGSSGVSLKDLYEYQNSWRAAKRFRDFQEVNGVSDNVAKGRFERKRLPGRTGGDG